MSRRTAEPTTVDGVGADAAPAPWSGRLAESERHRPGGELIAALLQCGSERGLDLHGIARMMGVSYWDLSPLRTGFRPVTAVDDDLAQACADFLGVPPATVRLLVGEIDAREALQWLPLDAVDIAHAWHRAQGRPGPCVPPAQLDPRRPLRTLTVDELRALWDAHGRENPAVRAALRTELAARPVSATERLRAALAEAPEAGSAPRAILNCTGCSTRLRVPRLAAPVEIRCPRCGAEYAVEWNGAVCLVLPRPPEPLADESGGGDDAPDDEPMSEARARAVLGVDESADAAAIERARRSLLQHYHPDRLGHVSPLVRRLAEEAFRRVNEAYAVLQPGTADTSR